MTAPYLLHIVTCISKEYNTHAYGLAQNERIEKLLNFVINFHSSGMKTQNFGMLIICSIIMFFFVGF